MHDWHLLITDLLLQELDDVEKEAAWKYRFANKWRREQIRAIRQVPILSFTLPEKYPLNHIFAML